FLGVEESLKNPETPCGLKTDAERARHVRKRVREMLNRRGEWELMPAPTEKPLREIFVMDRLRELQSGPSENSTSVASDTTAGLELLTPRFSDNSDPKTAERQLAVGAAAMPVLYPALSEPAALEKVGTGVLAVLIA